MKFIINNKFRDLNEKLEKLEINHKKSLASIKTLNSQLNRYKKEKAMIILPSTNPSPLSTERYSNKKPKKTEANKLVNFYCIFFNFIRQIMKIISVPTANISHDQDNPL